MAKSKKNDHKCMTEPAINIKAIRLEDIPNPCEIMNDEKQRPKPKGNTILFRCTMALLLLICAFACYDRFFAPDCQSSLEVSVNGTIISPDDLIFVMPGDEITATAYSSDGTIKEVAYMWTGMDDVIVTKNTNEVTFSLPEHPVGQTLKLAIAAQADRLGRKQTTCNVMLDLEYKSLLLFVNDEPVEAGSKVQVSPGDRIRMTAYPEEHVKTIFFKFGDEDTQRCNQSSCEFVVPESVSAGETYFLRFNARYTDDLFHDNKNSDNTTSAQYTFHIS